jgi:predicted Zn-dependent protease
MIFPKYALKKLSWLLAGLLFTGWLAPSPAWSLTYEEESKLGEETYRQLRKQVRFVDDQAVQDYVNQLGNKILKPLGPQPFRYRFFVIKDEVPNAFAIPGGYIFVNSGLIEVLDQEGELAATLGHEIGHVTARHISKNISQSEKLSVATMGAVLAGIFLGGPLGSAMALGGMAGAIQTQLKYSREDEREADARGLDYLVRAGYDPHFMMQSFDILLKASQFQPQGVPTYLETHPGLSERILTVESTIAAHEDYQRVRGKGDQQVFEMIQARLVAAWGDQTKALSHFQRKLSQDPQNAAAICGLGLIYENQQNLVAAEEAFRKALALQPNNTEILTDLGELLYKKGDFDAALDRLGLAAAQRPGSIRIEFLLARTYQVQGRLEEARDRYRRILDLDPGHEDSLYQLGLVYGSMNDLAQARLYTGLYFKAMGEPAKALYHLRLGLKQAEGRQAVRERIEETIREIEAQKGERARGGRP